MATPKDLSAVLAASGARTQQVSGNPMSASAMAASAQVFAHGRKTNPQSDPAQIAQPWQVECYRQLNICGEARYAATLFAAIAGRAEIGISQPQIQGRKVKWVDAGPEVDALAELAPDVRARKKLTRDFMLHYTVAGECYLIARRREPTDPGWIPVPLGDDGKEYATWDEYLRMKAQTVDVLDPDYDPEDVSGDPNSENPLWEIVAVTELRKTGTVWSVRHDNGTFIDLDTDDPVIRMWNPDPADRRKAWSTFRSLLPTLLEIEWFTAHIFTQVRSRLMSAGVWFLPNNMVYPPPPPDQVEGGETAIAGMNEAEKFMVSLAASGTYSLEQHEVSFPTVVMADPAALESIDQKRLIQFWSEIDSKAMELRSDAVRRFALGMDLPPEQVLGSSGLAVTGAGGSAGSVNHWGVWANEEQTISAHIEPALDVFVGTLTVAYLTVVVDNTLLVIGYDSSSMRLRQDRSAQAIELYDRGLLNEEVTLRENGFDPVDDKMGDKEFQRWLLVRITGGSATPEQVQAALSLLNVMLPVAPPTGSAPAGDQPGRSAPRSLDDHPYEGPPREDHDHNPAPFSAQAASCEVLVLRALEKNGNRLLNDGKRGKDRDRTTPKHLAHVTASLGRTVIGDEFDFDLVPMVFDDLSVVRQRLLQARLQTFCAELTNTATPYSREALVEALETLR